MTNVTRVQGRISKALNARSRRSPHEIKRDAALRAVTGILRGEDVALFELVTHDAFRKAHGKLRPDAYAHYAFLCLRNTRTSVGWVLCKNVTLKRCDVEVGLRKFDPREGTASLLKHMESHEKCSCNLGGFDKTKMPQTDKHALISKAMDAAVHGLLPLSFAYNRPGMAAFAEQLIKIGQSVPSNVTVDVLDLLPSSQGVADGLHMKAKETRQALVKKIFTKVLKLGGSILCDGLKQPLTGRKYYDLVIHYVQVDRHHVTGKIEVSLQSRVLVLVEHRAAESAEEIQKIVKIALNGDFDLAYPT